MSKVAARGPKSCRERFERHATEVQSFHDSSIETLHGTVEYGMGSLSHKMYLLISFRKSTPPQNRQLIVYYYQLKYQVDGFVGELTF